MGDLVDLIVDKYDGSLKAEHGTGLNMAPYVEREWGAKATEMMWRIKALADPEGVLAPGVLLNRDPGVHLRNLKSTPPIEEVADNCVECGFCEPVCPSRHLTTTPRQRIVLRREMARQAPGSPVTRALLDEYEYDALETCAVDGTCMLACPLGIDTGKLVKELRDAAAHGPRGAARPRCSPAAGPAVERGARAALRCRRRRCAARRARCGRRSVTSWCPPGRRTCHVRRRRTARHRPRGRRRRLPAGVHEPHLRARAWRRAGRQPCRRRWWRSRSARGTRSGYRRTRPGHCCADALELQGLRGRATRFMAARTARGAVGAGRDAGSLPVVIDASSCALGLIGRTSRGSRCWTRSRGRTTGCSGADGAPQVGHGGRAPDVRDPSPGPDRKARAACGARSPTTSSCRAAATCCGFAGDRGLLHPELALAATADEAAELRGRGISTPTCAATARVRSGCSRGRARRIESFVFALEQATRPAATKP